MFKKILFIAMITVFSTSLMAQSTQQKISDKVTVTFPGKPEETQLPNGTSGSVFTYKKDSTLSMIAMAIDLSQAGLTADLIQSLGDSFWDQMIGGITQQMQGATLTKSEKGTFKGQKSLYMEIDGANSSDDKFKGKKAYGYVFFIGANMHQLLYMSAAKDAKPSDAQPFFDNVKVDM